MGACTLDPLGSVSPFDLEKIRLARRKYEERLLAKARTESERQVGELRDELSVLYEQIDQDIAFLDASRERELSEITPELRQRLVAIQEYLGRLESGQERQHAQELAEFREIETRDEAASRKNLVQNIVVGSVFLILGWLVSVVGTPVTLWQHLFR